MTSIDRIPAGEERDAELLRSTERKRLRALVAGLGQGECPTWETQRLTARLQAIGP